MKNLIKIFVFFAVTILFAGSAYAQYDIPDPTPADTGCDRIPKPAQSSPGAECRYFRSLSDCHMEGAKFRVNESSGDCKVTGENAIQGSYHYYYSGNQYCKEEFIGTPYYSKQCVPRTDIVQPTTETTQKTKQPQQQQKTPPKIVAPKEPPKTTMTGDNQAWNQLLNLSEMITKSTAQTEDAIRGFFDSMFNNAKNFFKRIKL